MILAISLMREFMNYKNVIFKTVLLAGTIIALTHCNPDHETPASKKREHYVRAAMVEAPRQNVDCSGDQIVLPESKNGEELGRYIIRLHGANSRTELAKMSISKMQDVYWTCLRPKIIERLQASSALPKKLETQNQLQ